MLEMLSRSRRDFITRRDSGGHSLFICVDLVVGATPLPDFVHPEKAFYMFGPEDGILAKRLSIKPMP